MLRAGVLSVIAFYVAVSDAGVLPATEVLRGVTWSEALDEVFADNYRRDPTLSWQYFGSASGFFRNYPGISLLYLLLYTYSERT